MWKILKYLSISLPREEPNGASCVVLALVSALVDAARRTLDEHGRQVDHRRTLLPLQSLLVHPFFCLHKSIRAEYLIN